MVRGAVKGEPRELLGVEAVRALLRASFVRSAGRPAAPRSQSHCRSQKGIRAPAPRVDEPAAKFGRTLIFIATSRELRMHFGRLHGRAALQRLPHL